MPRAQAFESVQYERDARLHIERARPPDAAIGGAARHGGQRSQGIHGVEMAQQQDGLATAPAGKVHLQMVAEILDPMEFCMAADFLEAAGQERSQLVHGLLVVAG